MDLFLRIAYSVLQAYFFIMIIYILLSWTPLRNSQFYRILGMIVYPYLGIFRGWIVISNIDFTPMLGLIIYQFFLSIVGNAIS